MVSPRSVTDEGASRVYPCGRGLLSRSTANRRRADVIVKAVHEEDVDRTPVTPSSECLQKPTEWLPLHVVRQLMEMPPEMSVRVLLDGLLDGPF